MPQHVAIQTGGDKGGARRNAMANFIEDTIAAGERVIAHPATCKRTLWEDRMPAFQDITGQRFGRLVALEIARRVQWGGKPAILWRWRCDCGNERELPIGHVRDGTQVSCGCHKNEILVCRNTRHGDGAKDGNRYRVRLYDIWHGMRQRCRNPNTRNFHNYGGRGITVCDEWNDSYEAFRAWSLAHGYADHLTIDRINNDSGYEPANCRWTTYSENLRNKRPNLKLRKRKIA
jgi:hypothetical protein